MISKLTGYFEGKYGISGHPGLGGFWALGDTGGCIEGKITPLSKVYCILVYIKPLVTLSLGEACLMVFF